MVIRCLSGLYIKGFIIMFGSLIAVAVLLVTTFFLVPLESKRNKNFHEILRLMTLYVIALGSMVYIVVTM